MKPNSIRRLRRALGETRREFAARFCRSKRTVEHWELGEYVPDRLVVHTMRQLAKKIFQKSA